MSTVLISGGTSGLGLELAKLFAGKFNLVLLSSSEKRVSATKSHFSEYQDTILVEKCNVASSTEVASTYKKAIDKFGKIDILINNAGIFRNAMVIDATESLVDDVFSTNFKGTFNLIKQVLPEMLARKSGIITNISSVAATKVFLGNSIYGASKAAVDVLSNTLREEVRKEGIKVITVSPGPIATPIWSEKNLEQMGDKMLDQVVTAKLVFDNIIYSFENEIAIENIQLLPVGGDL